MNALQARGDTELSAPTGPEGSPAVVKEHMNLPQNHPATTSMAWTRKSLRLRQQRRATWAKTPRRIARQAMRATWTTGIRSRPCSGCVGIRLLSRLLHSNGDAR